MMIGWYELKPAAGSQWMWNLKAGNGEKILTSETYTSKEAAKKGIDSCRVNSPIDARYERKIAVNGQPYFVLRAANYEPIGKSETYSSSAAMENGISSCKENGPKAPVKE